MTAPASSHRALAEANYRNHIAALDYRNHRYLQRYSEGEFVRARSGKRRVHWCRLGGGVFNVVYGALLGSNTRSVIAKARIADITRRTSDRWDESVRWFVSSLDMPAGLGSMVEAEGWSCAHHWMEMGLETAKFVVPQAVQEIEIVRVRTDAERKEWMIVQCAGYDLTGRLAEFMDRVTIAFLDVERPRVRLYLARTPDHGPAGTAAIFMAGGAAGIYMVATHPERRRAGIATALMSGLIRELSRTGCHMCVLQSSEQAHALYRSLGFVDTGVTSIYRRGPTAV